MTIDYSDENFTGINLIPKCICTTSFNVMHIAVTEQSCTDHPLTHTHTNSSASTLQYKYMYVSRSKSTSKEHQSVNRTCVM